MKIPQNPGLRVSPADLPDRVIRTLARNPGQPVEYYLYQDVIEELTFAAGYEDRPYAAALTGGFGLEDRQHGFLEITGFVGGHWADKVEDLYQPLREECEDWIRSGQTDAVVGCFVSERGAAAHVSEEAARIHYSLFNIPFQVLASFDPVSRKFAMSCRAPGGPMFNAAFNVVVSTPLDVRDGDEEE